MNYVATNHNNTSLPTFTSQNPHTFWQNIHSAIMAPPYILCPQVSFWHSPAGLIQITDPASKRIRSEGVALIQQPLFGRFRFRSHLARHQRHGPGRSSGIDGNPLCRISAPGCPTTSKTGGRPRRPPVSRYIVRARIRRRTGREVSLSDHARDSSLDSQRSHSPRTAKTLEASGWIRIVPDGGSGAALGRLATGRTDGSFRTAITRTAGSDHRLGPANLRGGCAPASGRIIPADLVVPRP